MARVLIAVALVTTLYSPATLARSNRGDEWTVTRDFFACRTKDQFEESNDAIVRSKDGKVLARHMLGGQCRTIDSGAQVVSIETDLMANRIKFRQPGKEGTWWTALSFVSLNK